MSVVKRIMVVDDSVTVHKVIKKFLEPEGYQFCGFAKNGEEAVALYQSELPDMVFMDITMPVMDGITALQEIRKIDPKAIIVMLSAMGDEELMTRARSYGASNFLQKPFDKNKVVQAIKSLGGGA